MKTAVQGPATLLAGFERSVARYPTQIALEVDSEKLTYAELDNLATRISGQVIAGGPVQAVGVCSSRSVTTYAAYLATLRAGATVVPLSPAAPSARNSAICEQAGVDAVLLDSATDAMGWAPTGTPLISLVRDGCTSGRPPAGSSAAAGDDIAYVLFTSGSTGRPKGVPVRHRNVAGYLAWCAARYGVGPGCRLSQAFDLTFDPSVFDLFVAWHTGATVVVAQPDDLLAPAEFVNREQLTHWFSVPSVITLAELLGGLKAGTMPLLRWALFAGERLTIDQARLWSAAAPSATIENLYGPTELTITCTGFRLPRARALWPRTSNGTVPIGRPNPELQILLIDDDGRPVGEGELCVRGVQRFDGYLQSGDNLGRFVRRQGPKVIPIDGLPQPSDWYRTGDRVCWEHDQLVHLGRTDEQIKMHGFRIEPAEIEALLRRLQCVHEAVVVPMQHNDRTLRLEAFWVGDPVPGKVLEDHARALLPPRLVPARFHFLRGLPTTRSGKIDRQALRSGRYESRREY